MGFGEYLPLQSLHGEQQARRSQRIKLPTEHQPHKWLESTDQGGCTLSPVSSFSTWFPSLGKLHADQTFLKEPYNIFLDDET